MVTYSFVDLFRNNGWTLLFVVERLSRASFLTFAARYFPPDYLSRYASFEYCFIAAATAFGGAVFLAADALRAEGPRWTVACTMANMFLIVPMLFLIGATVQIPLSLPWMLLLLMPFILMPYEWFLGLQNRFIVLAVRVAFNAVVIALFFAAHAALNITLMQVLIGAMLSGPGLGWLFFALRHLKWPSMQTVVSAFLFVLNNMLVFWVARAEIWVGIFNPDWQQDAFINTFRPLLYFSGFVQMAASYAFIREVVDDTIRQIFRPVIILLIALILLTIELIWLSMRWPDPWPLVLFVIAGFTAATLNAVFASLFLRRGQLLPRTLALFSGIGAAIVLAALTARVSSLIAMSVVFVGTQFTVFTTYAWMGSNKYK